MDRVDEMREERERHEEIWQMYDDGLHYQSAVGISTNVPRYVDYFQGKQWGKVEKGTEQMPRMVFNIIKMICRNKKANLLSVPCRLIYKSESDSERAEQFTRFAEWWKKDARLDEIDSQAVDDAVQTGSYFYHFYWDNEATSKRGEVEGGCRVELIDVLNIFFANPQEEDEQKQAWILIVSREEVDAVKAMADEGVDLDLIVSDKAQANEYKDIEQDGTELCTVLTRYFKKDGEVFCEKAVKGTMVNEAFSITPTSYVEPSAEEDVANTSLPDKTNGQAKARKATLYPIVCGSYERRRNSIYGLGEVEGLIPNQEAVNIIGSMQAYNIMLNAWGKWKVSPDALNGQEITNEVGQVLTDYSKDGKGIERIQEAGFSNAPTGVLDSIISLTRAVAGSSEVLNGEVLGANMSGTAIAQLQAQASQPIEELRNRYWRVKEKQGKVLEQFFRLYYDNQQYTYETLEGDVSKTNSGTFNGRDYDDIAFDVVVEASGGTRSSSAGDINFLDNLLARGVINAHQYVQMYPSDAISNKEEILRVLERQDEQQIETLTAKLQQYEKQMLEASALLEKQSKVVDNVMSIVRENNQLRATVAQIYSESVSKIDQANEMAGKYNEVMGDATFFANELNKKNNATTA